MFEIIKKKILPHCIECDINPDRDCFILVRESEENPEDIAQQKFFLTEKGFKYISECTKNG